MQFIFQAKEFCSLSLSKFGYRDACPTRNDSCNLIVCNCLMYQAAVTFFDLFFLNLQLLLKFWKFSILQLGCFFQIVVLFCFLDLLVDILDLLT